MSGNDISNQMGSLIPATTYQSVDCRLLSLIFYLWPRIGQNDFLSFVACRFRLSLVALFDFVALKNPRTSQPEANPTYYRCITLIFTLTTQGMKRYSLLCLPLFCQVTATQRKIKRTKTMM